MNNHGVKRILRGYSQVTSGPVLAGDKYWSAEHGAWIPVTVNSGKQVRDFAAVIREKGVSTTRRGLDPPHDFQKL